MIINGERALAYVSEIAEVKPIEGYDRVEHARVNGWWVIVSKEDHFIPGDKCLYIEVDSKVPANDSRFEFLAKRDYKVKTLKMCKVFSQGLIMPLTLFPEFKDFEVNTDVTKTLGITYYVAADNARKAKIDPNAKYKAMAGRHPKAVQTALWKTLYKTSFGKKILFALFGTKKDDKAVFPKHFPYISKTDEERVENMPYILENKTPFIVTEKLDGTSCTYILERKKFGRYEFYVTSRNVRQLDEDQLTYHDYNIYWALAKKYDIEQHLKDYLNNNPKLKYVCIQGEGVGSVQGNPLKLKEDSLYVFNFIRSDEGRISSLEGKKIVESWNMDWVPILDDAYILPDSMEEFKQFATGKSVVNPQVLREGIVLRDPQTNLSFKNVSREYLMKHNG